MTARVIRLLKSFGFALKGLKSAVLSQPNFQYHIIITLAVIMCGVTLHISLVEWAIISLAIGLVLGMEMINTAIEKMVDFVSPGYHEQAGQIKDLAAGAVLTTAVAAAVTGILIFLPKLLKIMN